MHRKNKLALVALPIAFMLLAGCGTGSATNKTSSASTKPAPTATQGKTVVIGSQPYEGAANLKKFEDAAAKNPSDANAQVQAGVSARLNGNDDLAIQYYQKAIQADASDGIAYNNIGNIYFRDKKDAAASTSYYKKATEVQPTYIYGWWNLALAEQQLGQKSAAQQTVDAGLKVVPKTDPNYKYLAQVLKTK